MHSFLLRLGDSIDDTLASLGLDPHSFATKNPLRARRFAVWLLAGGETLGYAGLYYVFAALLLNWEQATGMSKGELTGSFTVAMLISALVSPLAGRAVDAGKGRWLLSCGMLGGAIALTLLATADTFPEFILYWSLIGVAQGACLYDPCFAFVTRTTGTSSQRHITRITLAAGFASTIAFPTCAFLADALGWRAAVITVAIILGLIGTPMLYAGATMLECCPKDTSPSTRKAANRASFKRALRNPAFWLIAAAFPLIGLSEGLCLTHIIPILTDSGITQATAVAAAALFGPMQVAGRLLVMPVVDRISVVSLTAISFAGVSLATTVLMGVNGSAAFAFTFSALFGAAYGLTSILRPVVTADALGRDAFGAISGWMALPFLASLAIAPHLGSVLWTIGGYALSLKISLAAAVTGLVCIIALFRIRKSQA